MGYKLTQKAMRDFRPLFINSKGRVVRDPTLERVLEHIADRTFQVEGVARPVKESGASISNKGLADQLGHSRDTIIQKVDLLIAMGVLVVEGSTTQGAKRLGVDLSDILRFNESPFSSQQETSSDSTTGCRVSRHKQIPLDPSISSISVDSSYNSSDDDDERDSEGDRDGGEEPHSPITDEESPTLEGSNPQPDPTPVTAPRPAVAESISVAAPPGTAETTRPSVEESPPAKAPGPQIDAQQLQNPDPKARNEWRPSSAAYEQARAVAPDVNLELVIVSYWMWTFEKKIDPSNTHWMRWVIGEQKKHDAQREKEREQQALAQRQEKPWYEKELKL